MGQQVLFNFRSLHLHISTSPRNNPALIVNCFHQRDKAHTHSYECKFQSIPKSQCGTISIILWMCMNVCLPVMVIWLSKWVVAKEYTAN